VQNPSHIQALVYAQWSHIADLSRNHKSHLTNAWFLSETLCRKGDALARSSALIFCCASLQDDRGADLSPMRCHSVGSGMPNRMRSAVPLDTQSFTAGHILP
jgi:hypothetical protein